MSCGEVRSVWRLLDVSLLRSGIRVASGIVIVHRLSTGILRAVSRLPVVLSVRRRLFLCRRRCLIVPTVRRGILLCLVGDVVQHLPIWIVL